jgi:HAD superfamily hydrolase (TIGR01509 family)
MTKAILWDNDGVLVDTERLYFIATRQVLRSVGIDLTPELYRDLFLAQGKGAWHLAEQKGIPTSQILELKSQRNDLYSRALRQQNLLVSGVEGALARLHGTCVMGIVTTSDRSHFNLIHESTGILKYFDFIVAAGDYTRSKPDPEPYCVGVERSGIEKHECIAIEDSERGLASALAASVRCLVIPGEMTRTGDFRGAHAILESAAQIPDALK